MRSLKMINIVVPLVGSSQFFDDIQYKYPKPLIEVAGRTMIELFLQNFQEVDKDIHYIFIVNESDCRKYHLDNILNILTCHRCDIVKIAAETKGAACSVLMAIEQINNNNSLIIANADQYIDVSICDVIDSFNDSDAGVITFESIHPRWSYVKLDKKNKIIETAEKKPLSNMAIAGFYYFRSGTYFIEAAMNMIKKDATVEGQFYISPVFNELVLKNKKLDIYHIKSEKYHTFYSPQKIKEYEDTIRHKLISQ